MLEQRSTQIELRAAGRKLEGYAAVFGQETRIGGMVEVIRAGAFSAHLATGPDVLALRDHNPQALLGRTKSGTLKLAEDRRGLSFQLDVPDTSDGRDLLALAERGDIGGASIGFRVQTEHWKGQRRELRAVELAEISIVSSWPAYTGTSVSARHAAAGGTLSKMQRYMATVRP